MTDPHPVHGTVDEENHRRFVAAIRQAALPLCPPPPEEPPE